MAELRSLKLRFFEKHIRAVPAVDLNGCPFAGPGVDIRGDAAEGLFTCAHSLVDWFLAREPGIALRTVSFDFESGRVLANYTYRDQRSARPSVVRVDRPESDELFLAARELISAVARCAIEIQRKRNTV